VQRSGGDQRRRRRAQDCAGIVSSYLSQHGAEKAAFDDHGPVKGAQQVGKDAGHGLRQGGGRRGSHAGTADP